MVFCPSCGDTGDVRWHLNGVCPKVPVNVRLLELGPRAYLEESRQMYGVSQGAATLTAILADSVENRRALQRRYRPRRDRLRPLPFPA